MDAADSPEWMREESDALVDGPIKTTSDSKRSIISAPSIKKSSLFSLANSSKLIATTRSGSTQFISTAPSYRSCSRRVRHQLYKEEDPTDPYYSPPLTFLPPEVSNDLNIPDQKLLAVLSSKTPVSDSRSLTVSTLISEVSDDEHVVKSAAQGNHTCTNSCVPP